MSRCSISRAALLGALVACGPLPDEASGKARAPIVYGADGRLEYFESDSAELRRIAAEATVALMPSRAIEFDESGAVRIAGETFGERASLCEGVRFAEQPAAAECTGTLVSEDLVLTAGHCLDAVPCDDLSLVFNYRYAAEGELAPIAESDVVRCESVVARRVDLPGSAERVDYAWLRIDSPRAVTKPLSLRTERTPIPLDTKVSAVTFGGGIPAKLEEGATLRDARAETLDYFVTNLDALHGASGSMLYDSDFRALGILSRGGDDFVLSDEGCLVTRTEMDIAETAREQATYLFHALGALDGALAEPPAERGSPGSPAGCSVARPGRGHVLFVEPLLAAAALVLLRRVAGRTSAQARR